MDQDQIKHAAQQYHRAMEAVEDIVTDALCETYSKITGKQPSDRMREALGDAVRHNI